MGGVEPRRKCRRMALRIAPSSYDTDDESTSILTMEDTYSKDESHASRDETALSVCCR